MKHPDITAYGELLIDLIGQEQGTLNEIDTLAKRPGGAPANFAVACSRLGADSRLIASVGNDSFGDFLIDEVSRHGVTTDHITRSELRTTLAFASLDEDATPDFLFYRDHNADTDIRLDDIDIEQLRGTDLLHFGSLSLTHDPVRSTLLTLLDTLDVRVSCDPNLRDDLWDDQLDERLREVLDHVDHLLLAEDELDTLFDGTDTREQAANAIDQHDIDEVIITKGDDGSELHTADAEIHMDAVDADTVDTTGAGDAFAAGYLVSRLRGRDRTDSLRAASQVAARCVESHGGMSALPDGDEIDLPGDTDD